MREFSKELAKCFAARTVLVVSCRSTGRRRLAVRPPLSGQSDLQPDENRAMPASGGPGTHGRVFHRHARVASRSPGTCRESLWLLPSGPDQVHDHAMRGDPPLIGAPIRCNPQGELARGCIITGSRSRPLAGAGRLRADYNPGRPGGLHRPGDLTHAHTTLHADACDRSLHESRGRGARGRSDSHSPPFSPPPAATHPRRCCSRTTSWSWRCARARPGGRSVPTESRTASSTT